MRVRSDCWAHRQRKSSVVHIFEPGGIGGVYQHSVALAQVLSEAGRQVVLHTAADHELGHLPIEFCPCFDWHRKAKHGRSVRVAADFVTRVLPHLVFRSSGLLWVQGGFKLPLTLVLIALLRVTRRRAIFSPHNLFVRQGRRRDQALLNLCLKFSTIVVVYNRVDEAELQGKGISTRRTDLCMYAPPISDEVMETWRETIRRHGITICSIGQLRTDKNLTMLVEACDKAGIGLLMAGPDLGAAEAIRQKIAGVATSRTVLRVGYLELEDLAAIVSITGVVALPYSVASQSAVAELALSYGAIVVAYDTGGLSEQAQQLVPDLKVDTWADVLRDLARECQGLNTQDPLPRASVEDLVAIVDDGVA